MENHTLSIDEVRFVVTDWTFDVESEEFVKEDQRVEEHIDSSRREPEDEFTCSCGAMFSDRDEALTHVKTETRSG